MRQLTLPLAVLLIPVLGGICRTAEPNEEPKNLPRFDAVKAIVHKDLARHDGYRSNDILTRERVTQALVAAEKKTGWKIEDRDAIAGAFLGDGDFLVRQLRTKQGTAFMRRFSGTPLAFDRIDRLRELQNGQRRIPELINDRGGHTLILYMATTEGGRNLGLQLANVRGGKNFNKPTGRLYTERQLLDRLKRSHDREAKYRKFGRPKKPAVKKRGAR